MFYRCIPCNLDFAILSRPFKCPSCNGFCIEESGLPISRSSSPSPPSQYPSQPITQQSDMALFSGNIMPEMWSSPASPVRPGSPMSYALRASQEANPLITNSSSSLSQLSLPATPSLFPGYSVNLPVHRSRSPTPELFATCKCGNLCLVGTTCCRRCQPSG